MRKLLLFFIFLSGCSSVYIPQNFTYKEIKTDNFTLASWQKITQPEGLYKIYIEGDGHSFNSRGFPTNDPTPHGTMVRELAFGDTNPNVIYLARPCQFIKSPICSKRHWTTARFAPEIIISEYEAIKQIAGTNPIILIGFSGGAQVAGLISATKPDLNIKKLITIAGNLDHLSWTRHLNLLPLNESMSLPDFEKSFQSIPQIHYVGQKDKVIPPFLTQNFIKNDSLIIKVENATHHSGWHQIFEAVWHEK